jgi:DNA-directed RNA polymerase subunit D
MEIETLEENAKALRFRLKGASAGYANALRRSAINGVDTFAIDTVTVYENTSAMFDEYIAHRIGLVPIKTPSKGYTASDEILFSLDATGPVTVYSKDLESRDKEVMVAVPGIPIMKLGKEQKLRLEGKARMATALGHAKFQPGLITFEENNGNYDFSVETFGQMPPREIVNKACEAIKEQIKDVAKFAKKL